MNGYRTLKADWGDPLDRHLSAERRTERKLRLSLEEWVAEVLPNISEANVNTIAQQLRDKDLYFRDVLQQALVDNVSLGANIAIEQLDSVGVGFDWTMANTDASDWARRHTNEVMQQLNVTNDRIVGEAVNRWIENQEPIQTLRDDIAQRVPGAYGRNRSQRAELIARTEVTRAMAEGERIAYKESGVVEAMEWRTRNDEIVCPFCGALNEKIVSIEGGRFFDELPQELQDKLRNRTFEVPPAHPGCRCFIAPVIVDVPDEASTQ